MFPRQLSSRIQALLRAWPAVALLGPRQAGKTTLARSLGGLYFDLEKESDRLRLDVEWDAVVSSRQLVVLDEAHEMPAVFSRLRPAIDEDRKRHGRFLLLGSVSPALIRSVGESLAGRIALCELAPLSASEIPETRWDELWRFGGYPDGGILERTRFPDWQQFYLDLLAQRDLPHWGLPARASVTQRLFRMLAAVHGQKWNASQLGKSLGLSYHTVNEYVDFLEQAYLVRRLPAWSSNIRKRLVRAPKLYWRDSGLLHALLDVGTTTDLLTRPWVGASWEGWVIEQLLGRLAALGQPHQAFHFRTSDQYEIDLLLSNGSRLCALEIKLTASPSPADLESLTKKAEMVGADCCYLVSRTTQPTTAKHRGSINLAILLEMAPTLCGNP